MASAFVGEIQIVAFNFAPKGWAFCNGQLLPINQNQALFTLLGTTYGGNGQTTFALPDLQSRVPIHFGQGPGLSNYVQGQASGEENHTLLQSEMPSHSHTFAATTATATAAAIGNTLLPAAATTATAAPPFAYASTQVVSSPALVAETLATGAVGNSGGNQPHANRMPYLGVAFVIALQGIFPSRN